MANVSEEFENWSSAKTFLSVLLLLVLLAAGLGWGQTRLRSVPGGGVGILDSNLYYTGDQAYHHLDSLGEDGRKIYKGLLFLDLAFAPVYPLFIAVAFGLAWKQFLPGEKRLWKLVPALFIITIFDWLENICILVTLYIFPQRVVSSQTRLVIAWQPSGSPWSRIGHASHRDRSGSSNSSSKGKPDILQPLV